MIKIQRKKSIMKNMNNMFWDLPTPTTLTYAWNFGSMLGICLITQILTGILLSFHYTSYSNESFNSIMKIMRDTWYGWVVRIMHMNGASMFFLFMYLHLFRGLYYASSVHKKVWTTGVSIMIILMAISFLGYVLPWGQMSYWAVAVITNLMSVIPVMGSDLVIWIWGGFSVGSPTLTRFYSLHFLTPFILSTLVMIHLIFLHKKGSSNPLGMTSNVDKMPFHPYFTIKDLSFIVTSMTIFIFLSTQFPHFLNHSINNVPANPMSTPNHIQPEWYFMTSYAILRSIPNKELGVIMLMMSVTIFYTLPLFKFKFSSKFKKFKQFWFWMILMTFIFLMKMGSKPAEEPYTFMTKVTSLVYFSSILISSF